jgi:2-oxoglutarate ferredoxin oxidoreductase subunit beta
VRDDTGCSSNLPGFIETYGMHTLHGRGIAVAAGVKLANHNLTVVITGGDGDGFGIGGNHFIHTMRRNVDLLYLAMDKPDLRSDHQPCLGHRGWANG